MHKASPTESIHMKLCYFCCVRNFTSTFCFSIYAGKKDDEKIQHQTKKKIKTDRAGKRERKREGDKKNWRQRGKVIITDRKQAQTWKTEKK